MNNYFSLCSFLILFASSGAYHWVNDGVFYSTKICFEISRITYFDLLTNGDRFLKLCSISEINHEIKAHNLNNSPYTNCFYCENSVIYKYTISVYMYSYDASCILPYPIYTDNRTFYTDSENLRNKLITENIKDIDWTRSDSDFKRIEYFTTVPPIYSKQYHNSRYQQKSYYTNPIENTTSLLLVSSNYDATTMNPGSIPLKNSMSEFDRTTSDFRQKTAKNRRMIRFPPRRYNHRHSWRYQIYTTMRPWRWNQHKPFTPRYHYNKRTMTTSPRRYYHGYFNRYNNGYNDRYKYGYESRFRNRNSWRYQIYTTMRPWRWNQHKPFTPRYHYNKRIMTTSPRRYYHGYFNRYNNGYNDRYKYGYESRFRNRNSWRYQIYSTMRPWRWNQHKPFTPRHYYNKRTTTTSPRRYYHGYFNRYNNGYNDRYNYGYESRFRNRNSWQNQIYSTIRPWRWNQHKPFTPRYHYNKRTMTTSPRRYYHGYFNIYNNGYNDRYNNGYKDRYNNGYNDSYNYGYESRFRNRNSWQNQIYTTMRPWRWNQHKTFTSTHYNERKMTILRENRRHGMNSNNYQYKYHKPYDRKKNEYFSSYFAKYPYFNRHDFFWLSIGFFIFGVCSLSIIGALIVKILSYRNKMEVIVKNKRSTLNGVENPCVELDVMPPRYDELNSNSNVIHNV